MSQTQQDDVFKSTKVTNEEHNGHRQKTICQKKNPTTSLSQFAYANLGTRKGTFEGLSSRLLNTKHKYGFSE